MNTIKSTLPVAQAVVDLCVAKGITKVVISPGSRNAPLTIGFSNHPEIEAFSIVDERSAAFFALGMAQQSMRIDKGMTPVALVCTSGSALLNYYPAVAEAFYSDIPLVIISADRPEHLIDVGDGQTIRQPRVFHNHILCETNLKSAVKNQWSPEMVSANIKEINRTMNAAMIQQGPVHINVPFDEPLYGVTDEKKVEVENEAPQSPAVILDHEKAKTFIQDWNSSDKKMILVGVNQPNQIEQKYLDIFAKDSSVVVFTETTSNLQQPGFFPSIDTIIAPIEKDAQADVYFEKLRPEILLTFGGMVVSKKIKAFLRKYAPKKHYHIDSKKAFDTFFCLTHHFQLSPNVFFRKHLSLMKTMKSDYKPYWEEIKTYREEKRKAYLAKIPYSDFMVFHQIFETVPTGEMLHVSNSSAIRYAQLFPCKQPVEVYCNRGTSGIDGSVSTAVGAAFASGKPTTMITGDLSFFYDSNALWNHHLPNNFKIIVVNNGGGGIFRILPGDTSKAYFTKYFETTHGLTAEGIAKTYGFDYAKVETENDLSPRVAAFFENDNKQILEVFTPREINDQVLLGYFEHIKMPKLTSQKS